MTPEAQQALNKKLGDAVDSENIGEVAALIASGADVNGIHCTDGCRQTALIKAAIKGNIPIIMLLLEKGADTRLTEKENKTAVQLAEENKKFDAVLRIKAFDEEKKPERVSFHSFLGDRERQDIYDFVQKERLTLIRQGRYGPVEAATITGFSAIEDQSDGSMLRKAFNEHIRRGGHTEETEVFTRSIAKSRWTLPKPG